MSQSALLTARTLCTWFHEACEFVCSALEDPEIDASSELHIHRVNTLRDEFVKFSFRVLEMRHDWRFSQHEFISQINPEKARDNILAFMDSMTLNRLCEDLQELTNAASLVARLAGPGPLPAIPDTINATVQFALVFCSGDRETSYIKRSTLVPRRSVVRRRRYCCRLWW